MKRLLFRRSIRKWDAWCDCFDAVCMGSPEIRLCRYIVYFNHFNNHNRIGVATWRGRGLQPPCKRSRYQSVTQINEAHRVIVKQAVYDEFMKQIRTVGHSFNTTGTANYRVQLAMPPSTNNNHNHNISVN